MELNIVISSKLYLWYAIKKVSSFPLPSLHFPSPHFFFFFFNQFDF